MQDVRKRIADQDSRVYVHGSNDIQHDPGVVEKELKDILITAKVGEVSDVYCSKCTSRCQHEKGLHIILEVISPLSDEIFWSNISLLKEHIESVHETLCSTIDTCIADSLKEIACPGRFHFRDAIDQDRLLPYQSWTNLEKYEIGNEGGNGNTEPLSTMNGLRMYPLSNRSSLAASLLRAQLHQRILQKHCTESSEDCTWCMTFPSIYYHII